jgi:hypothetical protein
MEDLQHDPDVAGIKTEDTKEVIFFNNIARPHIRNGHTQTFDDSDDEDSDGEDHEGVPLARHHHPRLATMRLDPSETGSDEEFAPSEKWSRTLEDESEMHPESDESDDDVEGDFAGVSRESASLRHRQYLREEEKRHMREQDARQADERFATPIPFDEELVHERMLKASIAKTVSAHAKSIH